MSGKDRLDLRLGLERIDRNFDRIKTEFDKTIEIDEGNDKANDENDDLD